MMKAVAEATGTCPGCGAEIIRLTFDEVICPKCGKRFPDGNGKGGTGPEHSSTGFLVESPPPSSTATHGEGSSGPLNPSAIPDKRPPMKQGAEYPDEEATNLPRNDEVPEAGKKDNSPAKFRSAALPVPAPPSFILTEPDASRLMMGSCDVNEAPTSRSLSHGGPTGVLHLGRANRKNSNGGRGSKERIRDIRDRPGCYALLCGRHHVGLDSKDLDTILSLGLAPWYAPEEVRKI